jgi:hypothetical protein
MMDLCCCCNLALHSFFSWVCLSCWLINMNADVVETLLFSSRNHAFMLHEHWLLLLLMLHEVFQC